MEDIMNQDAVYYNEGKIDSTPLKTYCTPFLDPSHLNEAMAQKFDNYRDDIISFLIYFCTYMNICINRYKWTGIDIIYARLIEKLLFYYSTCAIIRIDGKLKPYRYIVKTWNTETGEPQKIDCYDLWGNCVKNDVTEDEFVILYDNLEHFPKMLTVFRFCMKFAHLDRAIDSNIKKQFVPIILQGTTEQMKRLQILAKKFEQGLDYWFMDKDVMNQLTALDLHIDFKAPELYDVLLKEKNELNSLLGINNENINKESGVSEAEVNANDDYINMVNSDAFLLRQEGVTQILEKFDVEWGVLAC